MFKAVNKNLIFLLLLLTMVSVKQSRAQQPPTYPRMTGYFSIVNPIGSWNKNGFSGNFSKVYTIGFPFGLNLLKSERFGVSFEVSPFIRTENNVAKVSSVLFHPGAMFRFKHGFTFIERLAFETNGRFGFTPVFNKTIKKGKDANWFVSIPVPVRFGNAVPASVGTALQVGVAF